MDLPTNTELSEVSPFISIWTKPRQTMRWIVDTEPTHYVILLASVSGIFQALNLASGISVGDDLELWLIFLLSIVFGSIGGVIALYIGGALYAWSGKKQGGIANAALVRTALAWGAIPVIFGQLIYWVVNLLLYGKEMFSTYAPALEVNPFPLLIVYWVTLFFSLWGTVVLLKCMGEVHGFSAWKAWGAMIVGGLVVSLPILVLSICSIMFLALLP